MRRFTARIPADLTSTCMWAHTHKTKIFKREEAEEIAVWFSAAPFCFQHPHQVAQKICTPPPLEKSSASGLLWICIQTYLHIDRHIHVIRNTLDLFKFISIGIFCLLGYCTICMQCLWRSGEGVVAGNLILVLCQPSKDSHLLSYVSVP